MFRSELERVNRRLPVRSIETGLHAPHTNPMAPAVEGIDATVSLLVEQLTVCRLAGVAPSEISVFDQLVVTCGSLQQHRVYVHRTHERRDGDCGWYVGPVDQKGEQRVEAARVRHLLKKRRELVTAMALPAGFIAVFAGPHLDAIVDASNREVYRRGASA